MSECWESCGKCRAPGVAAGDEWHWGDLFVKEILFPEKFTLGVQHVHLYDHLTLIARGSVELFAAGQRRGVFKQGSVIPIKAGIEHAFQSLEDDTALYCIHNLRGGNTVAIQGV